MSQSPPHRHGPAQPTEAAAPAIVSSGKSRSPGSLGRSEGVRVVEPPRNVPRLVLVVLHQRQPHKLRLPLRLGHLVRVRIRFSLGRAFLCLPVRLSRVPPPPPALHRRDPKPKATSSSAAAASASMSSSCGGSTPRVRVRVRVRVRARVRVRVKVKVRVRV